ncbi:MAG: hypothetical protein ACI9MC_000919 [Kiritimatiellia bacterium]|jgi:hypothetical protein
MGTAVCLSTLASNPAGAGRPDDLRDDGSAIIGCSSLDWASKHTESIPFVFLRDGIKQLSIAGKFGADPTAPLWTVIGNKNGRQLPAELRLTLPEGRGIPGGIGMFIGSPRITQQGTDVLVLWIPPSEKKLGLVDLTDRVIQDVGCTAAAAFESGQPYDAVALHVGPEPDRIRAVFQGWRAVSGDDILLRIMPLVVSNSTEAPWNALAVSPESPPTAVRLNIETKPSVLLGLIEPPPPAAVLKAVDRVLLHPGTEVGLWPAENGETELAAVVPVRRPRTVMWWPGTLARQLKRQGKSVERRGRVVGIPLDEEGTRRLWISSRRGRLLLGTNPDRVESMRKLEGTPWFPRDQPVGPVANSHVPGLVVRTHDPAPMTAGAIYGIDGLLYADVVMAPNAAVPGVGGIENAEPSEAPTPDPAVAPPPEPDAAPSEE